jgi:MFS family permease
MTPASTAKSSTTLGIVFLVLFLDLVGFSIVFPLFADLMAHYAKQDSGLFALALAHLRSLFPQATPAQEAALFGGLLTGLYAGIQFFTAPVWGRLSDRYGRRPIILCSLIGSTLAYALWVITPSFEIFVLSRLLAGVMSGNVAAANAAVADITTRETRSRGMATVGIAFGLGFILGPAIGGLLSAVPSPIAWNPFAVPALVAFGLALGNLLWAYRSFRETVGPDRRTSGSGERSANPLKPFLPTLGAKVPFVNGAFFMHTLIFSGMEATLVFLCADRLGYTPVDLAWVFVALGLGSVLLQGVVFRRLAPRIGAQPLVLVGLIALAPALLCLGALDPWPTTWLLIIGLPLLSVGTGLVFPGLNTLVSLAGDPDRQGEVMGGFRSASALGRALGPLLAALVYFGWRPAGPYVVGAAMVLIPVLLVIRLRGLR